MKPNDGWAKAFLEQARSDFSAAEILLSKSGQSSQAIMLLQMAWEKLAKSALDHAGELDPNEKSHCVAARFASVMQRGAAHNAKLFRFTKQEYKYWLQGLKRRLQRLEELCPAMTVSENLEYPWQARSNSGETAILWPAAHLSKDTQEIASAKNSL